MNDSEQSPLPIDWEQPPAGVETIIAELRLLRIADGHTAYARIAERIAARRADRGVPPHERPVARSTVYDQFRTARKRLDHDLAIEIAVVLGLPEQAVPQWAARCRAAQTRASATSVVTLHDPLPPLSRETIGRRGEIDQISAHLALGRGAWISGAPGLGKTQVALEVAARARAEGIVSRGVLIDLRGFRDDAPPTDAAAVQEALLRHFSVPHAVVSMTAAARARALRRAIHRSRALLVLDDARDSAQVAAILGSGPLPQVLVTSRLRPPSEENNLLVLPLDRLAEEDAVALLRASAGVLVDEDRDAAVRLAALVDGLPLALELLAGRMRENADWTLSDHVHLAERRIEQSRLDEPLRSALELSFAGLGEQEASLARFFASSGIGSLDVGIAASILDADPDHADTVIARLATHSLLIAEGGGRWQMHAVPRAFARERSLESDPDSLRSAAHRRLERHLVQQVWSAYAALAARAGAAPRPARFDLHPVPMSAEVAEQWLTARLDVLLDAALAARAAGRGETLVHISEGLSWWLNIAGRYREALQLHENALRWAEETGDVTAQATASLDLGQLLLELQRPEEALGPLRRASRLEGEFEDPGIRGVLLNMIGVGLRAMGEHRTAIDHFESAIALHEELEESNRLLSCLVNLGVTLHDLERFEEELAVMNRAVALAEGQEHRHMLAHLLVNRAEALIAVARDEEALADARRGAALSEEVGFVVGRVVADHNIGEILLRAGKPEEALVHFRRASDSAEAIGRAEMAAEAAIGCIRALRQGEGDDLPSAISRAEAFCRIAGDARLDGMLARALDRIGAASATRR